ncbi:MAG TPA: hypothetical protein PLT66_05445, partial [Bacillota bacterium]|nr:hypothetical protein [Bacillota bacterium]
MNNKQSIHTSNVSNLLIPFLRDAAFAFIVFWLINPQSRFNEVYNWNIYGIILLVWICLAVIASKKAFRAALTNNKLMLIWLWPIYLFIASLFSHAPFSIKQFTTPFIFVFFIYYLNVKKSKLFKFTLAAVCVYILIICANTIILNQTNPEISRILAHGDVNETFALSSPLLADFNFVYSLTGMSLMLCALIKLTNKSSKKIIMFAVLAFFFYLLINVQYVLAIVLTVLFSLWAILFYDGSNTNNSNRFQWKIIMFAVSFIFILFLWVNLKNILVYLYDIATGNNIKIKLSMLINTIDSQNGITSLERSQLYLTSIKTFFSGISNFIFGVGYNAPVDLIGGHSQLFDTFGRYGIIGGCAWIMTIIPAMKHVLSEMPFALRKI